MSSDSPVSAPRSRQISQSVVAHEAEWGQIAELLRPVHGEPFEQRKVTERGEVPQGRAVEEADRFQEAE
ncbi:hypothetical protein ACH40F_27445 [Streptomyces sp. NPDC020794]|uniref:hypothetical protein n=1 Tax=unclassified Streptomyces TaxID=2593676 RepID=UPI0036EB796F